MNSNAVASWIQVVTGLAALAISIVTGLPALRGVQAVTSAAAPSGLESAQAALIVFAVLVVFAVGLIFLVVGVSALLAAAFRTIGAASPHHAAYCLTGAALLAALTGTLAIVGTALWVITGPLALLGVALAGIAQADEEKGGFWAIALGGTAIIGFAGLFVIGLMVSPASTLSDAARSESAARAAEASTQAASNAGRSG